MGISINKRLINSDSDPYVIAELSGNHGGSIEVANQMIFEAARCGADAVKIQTFTPDSMTLKSSKPDFSIPDGLWAGRNLYSLYSEVETPKSWHEELFNTAYRAGVTLFSTPFDEDAVDFLEDLDAPAYKIASFEALDFPLVRYAAKTGKPMIISTGLCTFDEIESVVKVARDAGCNDLMLMHCISEYPAPLSSCNLRNIPWLNDKLGIPIGLSDHTLGTTAAITAVALGAVAVEKHFILVNHMLKYIIYVLKKTKKF